MPLIRRLGWPAYQRLQKVFRWVNRTLLRFEVAGTANLPAQGAFLAVCNHIGIYDPALIFATVPRQMVMLSADKWQKHWFIGRLSEAVGVIWVARGEADTNAIKASLAVLKDGYPLGLAPEGTRSPTHSLQAGKSGAAYLADRARVPLVPMAITGTETLFPSLRRLQRPAVRLVVGRPFTLPGAGRAKSAELEAHTARLMCHIAALLPPAYRGVYADHPLLAEAQAYQTG